MYVMKVEMIFFVLHPKFYNSCVNLGVANLEKKNIGNLQVLLF